MNETLRRYVKTIGGESQAQLLEECLMRFRHLAKITRFTWGIDPTWYVKVDDISGCYIDNDGSLGFKDFHDGQPVVELPLPRWSNSGSNDTVRLKNKPGKLIAKIRVKSSPYKSELFVGFWRELSARIDELQASGEFLSFFHAEIRDEDVLTEREFREWSKLEDAIEMMRRSL